MGQLQKFMDNKVKLAAPRKTVEKELVDLIKKNHNEISYKRMRELISYVWFKDVRRNKDQKKALLISRVVTHDDMALAEGVAEKSKKK